MARFRDKKATIADVAKVAGVSRATVSRVLNQTARVSDEKVAAVEKAIATTGFSASFFARNLATGRSRAIGIIITEPVAEFFSDPTFRLILNGITNRLLTTDSVLSLYPMETKAEQDKGLGYISRGSVDGVIHLSPYTADDVAPQLKEIGIPTVFCGTIGSEDVEESFSHVYTDDHLGASLIGQHLMSKGVRSILALHGPASNPATLDRRQALLSSCSDTIKSEYYLSSWTVSEAFVKTGHLIKDLHKYDAIVCGNDRIAAGVISRLEKDNISIPRDIMVTGFDNHTIASDTSPSITTIQQPFAVQGNMAVQLVNELLAGQSPRTVVLTPQLIVRDSTGDVSPKSY